MNKRISSILFACLIATSVSVSASGMRLGRRLSDLTFFAGALGSSCVTNYMAQKSTQYQGCASWLVTLGMVGWAVATTHLLTKNTKDLQTRRERTALLAGGHVVAIAFGLVPNLVGKPDEIDGFVVDTAGILKKKSEIRVTGLFGWLFGK